MKVIWNYLSGTDKGYLVAQIPSDYLSGELLRRAQQPLGEDNDVDDEEKFGFESWDERGWAFRQLTSKAGIEESLLVSCGHSEVPLWLKKEVLARRQRVKDEGETKVYCTKCDWMGTRNECPFGHDDVACPICQTETIIEEVS